MKSINAKNLSVFITGANGGMGLDTSRLLIKENTKRITLAARSSEKAEMAKRILEKENAKGLKTKLEAFGDFDMTDPDKIKEAVSYLPLNKPYDIVFLQAGGVVFKEDYQFVEWEGKKYERTVFQNVIGGYVTLVALKEHGLLHDNTRVVFAGGEGARGIPGLIEKPHFKGYADFKTYLEGNDILPKYNPMNAIGVSKLMSAVLTIALSKKTSQNQEFVWFTPGLTYGTNGLADTPALQRFFMERIMFPIAALFGFAQSPIQGAKKYMDSLLGVYGKNGDVLGSPEGKVLGAIVDQKPMNTHFTDRSFQNGFLGVLEENFGSVIS